MKKAILIVALFATTSAQSYDLAPIKELVGRELKDPWSAHYRNIHQSGKVVCGEVNAKNAMGGYGGWLPFIVREKKAMVISEADEDMTQEDIVGTHAMFHEIAEHIRNCLATGVWKEPDFDK